MDETTTLAPLTMEEATSFLDTLVLRLSDFAVTYGMRLIVAILLLIVGFKLSRWLTNLYKQSKLYKRLDPTVRSFLKSVLFISLRLLIIISAAAIMGIPMSSMVALVTSAGLTIGLALQGGLSNIAGGFVILVFKPFSVGDYISFSEYEGYVKSISIFYTKIITLDNRQVMIPNSVVSNNAICDNTALPLRRVDLKFGVAYDSDIDEVRRVLLQAAKDDPDVVQDPAPTVVLSDHDESAMRFVCRAYCPSEKYLEVYFRLMESAKRAFDANGIVIPFPQMDVHVDTKK